VCIPLYISYKIGENKMAWLTGWNYRKATTISNTGSALTDYQTSITLDTATLVTAGKLLPNCNDIRFTSSDGITLLNYWIESGPNTGSTKIWLNIPSISSGSNTIYIYYGNPGASPVSSGTNTFILFDHFDGSSLDTSKWLEYRNNAQTTPGTYTSQSNSILTINAAPSDNSASILSIATNLPNSAIVTYKAKQAQQTYPYSILAYGNGATLLVQGYRHHGLAFTNSYLLDNTYNAFAKYNAGSYSQIDATANLTPDWGNYNIYSMNLKTADTDVLRNGTSYFTGDGTNILTGTQRLSISGCYASNGGGNLYVDYVHVRKYASSEPTVTTIGMEEITGDLNISSTPSGAVGASVYIDGNVTPSGVTPLIVTGFSPGTHTYRLTKTGYTEIPATNFSISSGQTTTISQAMVTVANITATAMTITPNENPCRTGICTITVSVTWTNNGESTGSFVPLITVGSGSVSPIYLSEDLDVGEESSAYTFTVSGMVAGTCSICPNPN
jgi:hypothetical protein